MLSDPQTVTIDAAPYTLARTGASSNNGTFQKDDSTIKLTIQHNRNKRLRHFVRLDHNKLAADPYVTGDNIPVSMGTYLVVDVPLLGYTVAEQQDVVDGFVDYLDASSGAIVTKILGGEI